MAAWAAPRDHASYLDRASVLVANTQAVQQGLARLSREQVRVRRQQ